MRRTLLLLLCSLALRAGVSASFDPGWRFHLGDVAGAQEPLCPDQDWRGLDLPHDWSIEQPFDKDCKGHDDTGYLPGGIGWYRKTFTLPAAVLGGKVGLRFDGVYMDSEVWLNGHRLGSRPYGYSSFRFDLSPWLKADGPNVLAVKVNVQQPSSRWYSGAGIYRHVWLETSGPVHVAPWGVWATASPAGKDGAQVRVRTAVQNESAASADVTLRAGGRDAEDAPGLGGPGCPVHPGVLRPHHRQGPGRQGVRLVRGLHHGLPPGLGQRRPHLDLSGGAAGVIRAPDASCTFSEISLS